MDHQRTLFLPPAGPATAHLLAAAATARGIQVRVLLNPPVPTDLAGQAHLFGGPLFADALTTHDQQFVRPPTTDRRGDHPG